MTIITLTTDFGTADGYPGIMKGVILGIAPEVVIVDISHDIGPQDIRGGAFVLQCASPYFPQGTIHLAVVDPGVGSERRALAVQTERAFFVAPDNGVLSWALANEMVLAMVSVTNSAYWLPKVSGTFHGRDIFAPVAAHLACGVPLRELGDVVDDPVTLPLPRLEREVGGVIRTEVVHIDRFGNVVTGARVDPVAGCITNLPRGEPGVTLERGAWVEIGTRQVTRFGRSYAEVGPGELVALVGSFGYLEIAVRDGNAARTLRCRVGEPVRIGARR